MICSDCGKEINLAMGYVDIHSATIITYIKRDIFSGELIKNKHEPKVTIKNICYFCVEKATHQKG